MTVPDHPGQVKGKFATMMCPGFFPGGIEKMPVLRRKRYFKLRFGLSGPFT
jgi:hypothetical protein